MSRRRVDQAAPTLAREPDQWSVPVWLGWPPAMLLVLVTGAAGVLLSCSWAIESYQTSIVVNRLLARGEAAAKLKPLPESVAPPDPTWWRTSPQHLAFWGVYLGRSRGREDRAEEGNALLEGAVRIGPLNPTARLARAQLNPPSKDPTELAPGLGLSRDAISLAFSARALRTAGKKDAALRTYRQALSIACRSHLTHGSGLVFNDDPNERRYLLPGEAIAGEIIRELTDDAAWSFQEWSDALPKSTVAPLVAARLLRDQGRSEADTLIKMILEEDREMPADGNEEAIRLAVIAEAHALRSQWKEAERQYRLAIELIGDSTIKRSWWFNLADIEFHLDDETQRQTALKAALAATTSDDISRRASDLQRTSGPRGGLRSTGPKAN